MNTLKYGEGGGGDLICQRVCSFHECEVDGIVSLLVSDAALAGVWRARAPVRFR